MEVSIGYIMGIVAGGTVVLLEGVVELASPRCRNPALRRKVTGLGAVVLALFLGLVCLPFIYQ